MPNGREKAGPADSLYNDTWRLQPAGSIDANPTHTYTAVGTYPVTLQVCNADGYTRTNRNITVTQPAPGLPLTAIAIGGVIILALIGGGYLIRRWWIQR